MVLTLDYFLVS